MTAICWHVSRSIAKRTAPQTRPRDGRRRHRRREGDLRGRGRRRVRLGRAHSLCSAFSAMNGLPALSSGFCGHRPAALSQWRRRPLNSETPTRRRSFPFPCGTVGRKHIGAGPVMRSGPANVARAGGASGVGGGVGGTRRLYVAGSGSDASDWGNIPHRHHRISNLCASDAMYISKEDIAQVNGGIRV